MTAQLLSVLIVAIALSPVALTQSLLPRKAVAAPPSDIANGRVVLPDPAAVGEPSRVALVDVAIAANGQAITSLPAAFDGATRFALIAPDAEAWSVVSANHGVERRGDQTVPWRADLAASLVELSPVARPLIGERVDVQLHAPVGSAGRAVLVVPSDTSWSLRSQVTDWRLTADRSHVIQAWIAHDDDPGAPTPGQGFSTTLALWDAGIRRDLVMHDDGRHGDGAAGDGVFGVVLPSLAPGDHVVRVQVEGSAPDGAAVLLTDVTLLPVAAPALRLGSLASGTVVSDGIAASGSVAGFGHPSPAGGESLRFELPVMLLDAPRSVHVSAEVWGTTSDGDEAPVAWLSSQVQPIRGRDGAHLPLTMSGAWLDLAAVTAPLHLRAVRVQDPDSHVVLALRERVAVDVTRLPALQPLVAPGGQPPAPSFTGGPPPGFGPGAASVGASGAAGTSGQLERALLLVHGYCSDGIPWPVGDFSGDLLSLFDPEASRSHDEFAQLVGQLGAETFSHGIVAHSQGGMAALQLLTYYWSGLDLAEGPRRIQSLGTPYLGTPLAGAAAVLADIFGTGCGSNDDLAPDGAALWLSTIPSWARAEVSYYTTEPSSGSCNFFSNLFLPGADDGVIQVASGQLTGASNMGNTIGQCHTTGMSQPAHYQDGARNAILDAEAAR